VSAAPADNPLAALDQSLAYHLVNTLGWGTLRPLQRAAIDPVLRGGDALLLAPTAGGKTEAAVFPVLSRMNAERWSGLSVLYLCPLKALLNNLLPRLEVYGGWAGRRVALWHGDTTSGQRKSLLLSPPDILLTTPESLESMLVSTHVDHQRLFAGLRTVIVDEVHAFGGDDRGWHLLAVLERLTRLRGEAIQRIGLSATVGNPDQLLHWLQGSGAGTRAGAVVAPSAETDTDTGEARNRSGESSTAVSARPAANAEQLGAELRERGVLTYLIHASLSLDERRRAEQAFAEGRDCVIVSTSALELGLDVGDLDRVIQVNAPGGVAGFLQRLGRTGRRTGTRRNCLFLALREEALLEAAGLLLAWSRGFVEPVAAPASPRHITAQQLLALCLQEGRVGERTWQEWLPLPALAESAEPVAAHLVAQGYLERDGGMLFIGPEAERRFGQRHFMSLMAVFTAPPEFTVLHGRDELGRVDPSLLADRVEGPRLLLLGGRSWRVTWTDFKRRRCFVEPAEGGGRARWLSGGVGGLSFEITRAMRDVLLGADVPVTLTQRASGVLAGLRSDGIGRVWAGGLVVSRGDDDLRWWTWAGHRVNATLKATLGSLGDESAQVNDLFVRLRKDLRPSDWRPATDRLCLPEVDDKALAGLKFSEALPRPLAEATLAVRLADLEHAGEVLGETCRFER
jgi:ATP-dependent Lhr-like helicase